MVARYSARALVTYYVDPIGGFVALRDYTTLQTINATLMAQVESLQAQLTALRKPKTTGTGVTKE